MNAEHSSASETGCCRRFDPEPWDEREVTFDDRLFVKDRVFSIFHIPINFGRVMKRNMKKIEAAGALSPEAIVLSDDQSPWRSDVYIAVTRDVPEAEMARISGTFLGKVFEGAYSNMRKWIDSARAFVASKGKTIRKMYFFYTTCPRCAKVYGKNYVVILSQI